MKETKSLKRIKEEKQFIFRNLLNMNQCNRLSVKVRCATEVQNSMSISTPYYGKYNLEKIIKKGNNFFIINKILIIRNINSKKDLIKMIEMWITRYFNVNIMEIFLKI